MQDYGEAANYVLFSSDTLAAGNHTLVINITRCVNQTFILDYITYTPSFSTFATMPNLTNLLTTTFKSSQSNVETKKIPIGAIIWGVLGDILFFVPSWPIYEEAEATVPIVSAPLFWLL